MAFIHQIFKELSLLIDPSTDTDKLINVLSKNDIDWDVIVKAGSQQLVLPAIYCNLKIRGLLNYIPKDLCKYLEELTSINRNRNSSLITEINEINKLFNKNKIEFVFLKGSALLLGGYYKDEGERMIGDIDILVHPIHINKAQQLLLENGYKQAEKSLTDKFQDQKHLPRLISDNKLAAVELHKKLLHKKVKRLLKPMEVLHKKQFKNNTPIPSNMDLMIHTALNFQVNDYGYEYNYLSLRSAYDVLVLYPNFSHNQIISMYKHKILRSYFNKLQNYFDILTPDNESLTDKFLNNIFLLKQKNKFLNAIWCKLMNVISVLSLIINRFILFIVNPNYRKESFKERKRILKFIKNRI